MKIGRKSEKKVRDRRATDATPAVNNIKRNAFIIILALLAVALIMWVWNLGKKAEQTVVVAMWTRNIYKNEVITGDMVEPYEMLLGEYEKLSIRQGNGGELTRRVILWEDINSIMGGYAAYPLQGGTYAEYRSLIRSRISNTDSVLYSFPGKDVVQFEVAGEALTAFKTFLKPGDRLNITAIYSENIDITSHDAYGNEITTSQQVYRSEIAFGDIMVADMLNSGGESILDLYAEYDNMSAYAQAQLDGDATWRARTTPASLLVALTPEEQDRYYYFLAKNNIQFKVSMPQRAD